MTKTANYNLNQWESTDPIRREDFNADNAAIDAALAGKAEQSVVAALQSAVSGKGNCCIATGSYVGTGTYKKANPTTLSFDFCPVLIVIASELDYVVMVRDMAQCQHQTTADSSAALVLTWSGSGVSWYNGSSDYYQLNVKDATYQYVAIGY